MSAPVLRVWWRIASGEWKLSELRRFQHGIRAGETACWMNGSHGVAVEGDDRVVRVPYGGDWTYFELMTLLSGGADK
jgi:hypothetical protein